MDQLPYNLDPEGEQMGTLGYPGRYLAQTSLRRKRRLFRRLLRLRLRLVCPARRRIPHAEESSGPGPEPEIVPAPPVCGWAFSSGRLEEIIRMLQISPAVTEDQVRVVRTLFEEYAAS